MSRWLVRLLLAFVMLLGVVSPVGAQERVDASEETLEDKPAEPGEVPADERAAVPPVFESGSDVPAPFGVGVPGVDGLVLEGPQAPIDVTGRSAAPVASADPVELRNGDVAPGEAPVFKPIEERSGSVGLEVARSTVPGVPVELVVPEVDRGRGREVRLSTPAPAVTSSLSPLGVAFQVELAGLGGVPAQARGLDLPTRRGPGGEEITDLGGSTGWFVEVDLDALPSEALTLVQDRLEIVFHTGCDAKGVCRTVESLPSDVDAENGVVRAELPRNVLNLVGGSEAKGVAVPGVGRGAGGSAIGVMPLSSLVAMFQGSQNSYFSVNTTTSGAQGNYSATSLASLSSWQVGTSTGHFETSFQVAMPPSVGPVPAVGLSYSSGTVDGMNTVSNNQSGLVGLGWNLSMPVITRATRPCTNNDAGGSYNDNLCFAVGEHDGFSLSMDGVGGRLVRTSASADEHPNYPPGSGITFHTYVLESMNDMRIWKVQAPDLPDDQGNPGVLNSWWEITTGDGTLHVFGRDLVMKPTTATTEPPLREDRGVHAEPAASLERLDSNLTAWMYIPGYAHATECVTGTNLCEVVTAWHLDQSIDTSGNMSIRRYWSQGNFYKAKHGSTDSHRSYVRAVHPMSWDYGMTFGDQLIPEASHSSAPQRVRFEYAFRNEIGGAGDTWYDTPTDLLCGSSGCTKTSPSYFTEYAIVQFRTFAGSMASRYALTYTWPQSSDSLDGRKLFLESIQQQSGSGLNMPPVSYDLVMLGNRVNHPSGVPEMQMPRIDTVTTEFGGVTSVNYGQSHAPTTSGACNKNGPTTLIRMPCDMFPSYDAHTGAGGWVLWNKWKTLSVTQDARVGGSANQTMTYSYIDAPSWAYSESWGHNGQAASQCATGYGCNHWNDYRGHQRVAVTDADGNRTEHFFITGMAEDRWNQNAQSGTVASNTGGTTAPEYALDPNGHWRYNTIAHRGRSLGTRQETDTGALKFHDLRLTVTATVSAQTSWPTVYRVTQENSYPVVWDLVAAQIDTRRRVITYYDHRTRISRVRDDGDWTSAQSWNTGDERSTCYYYSENEPDWIVSLPHTVATTDSEACSAWGNWTTATVYNYDGGAFQVAPTQGRVTQQLTQIRRSGSSPVWQTTNFSHNTRGQVLSETNANISGATTTYTYDATRHWLATTDGPLPGTDDKTTFIVDPRWGVQTQIQAPNSQTTNLTYDGLGRLLTVTLPGAPKASYEFTYTINQTGNPSRVATETLRNPGGANEYIQTFEFLDGFARSIQTRQAPANGTGAIVTSQFYDDIGQVRAVSAPFLMTAGPGVYESHGWGGLARTVYSYDTLGTTTTEVKNASGTQATSSVAVRGNQTTVTDVNGETTVTTVDTFGRTSLVVDANGGDTEYTYNTRDDLLTITDPQNNVIENTYANWELQPTELDDPDLGVVLYEYDSAGRLDRQRDGRLQWLDVNYDVLSRPTSLTHNGATVSTWDYDPAGAVGLLESSTHYNRVGSASNGIVTKSYTYDSRLRPTNIEWDIAGFVDDIGYAYRESGALDTVTYPDGTQSSYGYDALERPTTLTYDGDTVVRGVTYNVRGQVANLLRGLPDWTGGNEASLDTAYTYEDWSGRIVTAATTGHQPNAGVSGSIVRMYAAVLDRGTDAGETRSMLVAMGIG